MSETPHKPAGYCPRCGYAMDPGRCSECGASVSRRRLAWRPPQLARRQRWRIVLALGGVVLMLVAYQMRLGCMPYVPAHILLLLQSEETKAPTVIDREILRRLVGGLLTPKQRQQVFERGLIILPNFGLQDRCPASRPLDLNVRVETTALLRDLWSSGFPTFLQLEIDELQVVTDGQRQRVPTPGSGSWPAAEARFVLTGQAEGKHEVELLVNASIRGGMTGPVLACRIFTIRKTIHCETGPCEKFSKPVWSQRDVEFLRSYAELAVGVDENGQPAYSLLAPGAKFMLAGRLQFRLDESQEWRPLAPQGSGDFVHVFGARFSDGVGASYSSEERMYPDPSSVPRFDVRWVPDACAAWSAGCDEHFGGVIEWIGLKLTPTSGPSQLQPTAKPTRVLPASD